jgi:hypothetical protein
MIGRSVVNSVSNSESGMPCGCSDGGCSRIRSTTLTTRTFSSGISSRRIEAAASVSSVGTSPAQASTTSGSLPASVDAHGRMPGPRVQCAMASSMPNRSSTGCLPATITFT